MRNIQRNFFLLAVLASLLSACVKPEEVLIEGLDAFRVQSFSGSVVNLEADLKITNLSGSKVALKAARVNVRRNGMPLMELLLREPVVVPRRSSGVYSLPLAVRFEGLGGILGAGTILSSGLQGCTLTLEATVRGGWARKTVRREDIPVDTLLRQAGIDPAEFFRDLPRL